MAKLKDGFYKQTASSIGSDLYVLLAGGGSKALSDFAYQSDLTGFVTGGPYLPLTGGTLTGQGSILVLKSTNYSSYISFDYNTTRKATVGAYNGLAYIANETVSTCPRIGVNDDGIPQYWDGYEGKNKYNLLHSGNYSTYALPLTGGALIGPLVFNGTDTDRNIIRINNGTGDATTKSNYGFTLKYLGSGTGNENALALYSDNQTAISQIQIAKILQDGTLNSRSILPISNNTYSLGSSSYKWSNIYATTFTGNLTGNASSATKIGAYTSSDIFIRQSRPDNGFNIDEIELFGMRDIQPSSEITRTGTFPFDGWGSLMSFNGINYFVQLATSGTSSGMYFRSAYGSAVKLTDKPWVKFLDSSNYTDYTVKKDGTGASGTWGINISGSSGSSATSTQTNYLKILDIRDAKRNPNSDTYSNYSVTAWFSDLETPIADWHSGLTVKGWHAGYTVWQLCSYSSVGTDNNYDLYFRNGNNNTWGTWKTILDSSNYSSTLDNRYYTETEVNDLLGNYYPIIGGNMSGDNRWIGSTMGGGTDYWRIGGHGSGDNGTCIITVGDNYNDKFAVEIADYSGTTYRPLEATYTGLNTLNLYVAGTYRQLYSSSAAGAVVHSIVNYSSSPYGLLTRIYGDGCVSLQSQRETTSSEYFTLSLNPLGGNVAIGGTTADEKLHVHGNIRAAGNIVSTGFLNTGMVEATSSMTSSFRTSFFGSSANGERIKLFRDTSGKGSVFAESWSPGLAIGAGDVNGYISFQYDRGGVKVGGGNSDKINWSGNLIGDWNIGSQSVANAAYATSAGNADTVDDYHASSFYVQGRGDVNAQVDLQTIPKDISGGWRVTNSGWAGMVAVLAQGHNASNRAIGFLFKGGQSSRINLLTQVDNTWSDRGVIAYTSDIPAVTNYYWADQLITSSAKSDATPTFGGATINGNLSVTKAAGSAISYIPLQVTGTGTLTGQRLIQAFSPDLPTGTSGAYGAHIILGVKDSARNFGYMKFVYAGDGSVNNAIRFGFHSSDNLMSIVTNGNVGIGTINPAYALDVNGSIRANVNMYATAYYESSDIRLKNFIKDVSVDLNKIRAIPKKYFTWKKDTSSIQIGTSAQAVQKLYPELVSSSTDGYLSVDYSKLSVIALKGIDELYDMILELRAENRQLREQIRQMQK